MHQKHKLVLRPVQPPCPYLWFEEFNPMWKVSTCTLKAFKTFCSIFLSWTGSGPGAWTSCSSSSVSLISAAPEMSCLWDHGGEHKLVCGKKIPKHLLLYLTWWSLEMSPGPLGHNFHSQQKSKTLISCWEKKGQNYSEKMKKKPPNCWC